MIRFFLLSAGLMVFLSCSTSKKTVSTEAEKPLPYKRLLTELDHEYPEYSSMKSDIRLNVSIDGTSYSATGKFIHVRDKGIFASVRKLGFEIGRVLITQDSFFLINRWERMYVSEPLSVLEREYDVRGDFSLIEELLTGLPRTDSYVKNKKSIVESGMHRANVPSLYTGIQLILWLSGGNHEVLQAYYSDDMKRGIRMKYNDEKENNVILVRELHTENIEDGELHVKLEFRNPEFEDVSLPTFTIPSHYTRSGL